MPGLVLSRPDARPLAVVVAVVAVLAGAWTTVGVLPAAAHDDLVSSVPAAGEQLAEPPTQVALTFTAAVNEQFAQVAVVDAAGTAYQVGAPVVAGDTVTQAVADLPTGSSFTISYRIVSSDGHPIGGTVPFSVAAGAGSSTSDAPTAPSASPAATTEPTPEPSAEPSAAPATAATAAADGSSALPWVLGGAVLLAAAGVGLWLSRRRAAAPAPERDTSAPTGSG